MGEGRQRHSPHPYIVIEALGRHEPAARAQADFETNHISVEEENYERLKPSIAPFVCGPPERQRQ